MPGTMRWVLAATVGLLGLARVATAGQAPEFTHTAAGDWVNSAPLTVKQLRGKVVLVEFWTFDCVNCLRSMAWIQAIAEREAAAGLVVVGVHTPELPQERVPDNVRAAVRRLGVRYPVMLDGDYSYWNALHNRYWPAFFLVDRDGRLQGSAVGEMHLNERGAQQFEARIRELLAQH